MQQVTSFFKVSQLVDAPFEEGNPYVCHHVHSVTTLTTDPDIVVQGSRIMEPGCLG